MGKLRTFIIILMSLVFLAGLGISLYPTISGAWIDYQISLRAEEFLDRDPQSHLKHNRIPQTHL